MVREEKLSKQTVTVGTRRTIVGTAWRKINTHKKKIVIGAFVALLVGAGAWFVYTNTLGKEDVREVRLLTEAQADQLHLKKLQAKTPAANTSAKDKASYYRRLEVAKANVDDYKGAVEAFKQREALVGDSFTYSDYLQVANYYYRLKDNAAALAALDKAESLLPAADNVETGYSKVEVLTTINQFRGALR